MSHRLELTSMARYDLSIPEWMALYRRADELGVRVVAGRSIRRGCWKVVVTRGQERVELFGKGPLYAVACGALSDFEEAAA